MGARTLIVPDSSLTHWASLSVEAALTELGTNGDGLDETEAALRLGSFGPNTLPHAPPRAWYLELAANFVHLFALLLWAGAGLAWIAGMPQLTWAIIAVILINGMFSYWQEYKAGRAAEALRALLPVQVTIRRAGQQRLIPVSEVVPGDILVLAEGAAVPADARIIEAEQLRVDTSSLTGESRPVRRIAEPFSDTDRMAGTIPNLAFAGTFVTSGRGVAVVFATGTRTEFGRIAAMTVQQPERPSPLQEEIRRVTRLVTLLAIGMGALVVPPHGERKRWQVVGDPTEAAILVASAKAGLSQDALAKWPRLTELPFDSVRKRMTTIQQIDGAAVACVKGAPSELFPRCSKILWNGDTVPFGERLRRAVEASHNAMASRGLRVLAVATREVSCEREHSDGWRSEEIERELTLLGLLAMEDPPRPEVKGAIAACRRAGVRIRMITGDDGMTAAAIGREIGLYAGQVRVITGAELDTLSDDALALRLGASDALFARISPEHKLRLVEACQRRGEVVAVTGDGVNDAPALKRADIGVAMGATGTDVAREAADMVLADDNFASIVAAIEEGRAVYDNVRKFITYIFASNIPEVVPFIAFVLFQIPLPLTVMQILAVDLGTDLLPALALGMERPEWDLPATAR